MEHPLRVDEYIPSAAVAVIHDEPAALTPATPLPPLPSLPASDALLLQPNDADYAKYLPSINLRRQLRPALRAVCKTEHAVAVMVDWVRSNNLKFAVRCGGHSYEGFSQSTDVVIDVRGLKKITVDKPNDLVTAGSGVSLYEFYQAVAAQGMAVQAGSCPTVGLSGHLTGGGHGLLARSHGLTCDTLQQVTVVDVQARTLQASATSEPDLFWACRGGGGGSFGVATEFRIGVFALDAGAGVRRQMDFSPSHAARLFAAWQAWAPNAPGTITPIMKVGPYGSGQVKLRCIGQSVGTEAELRSQLAPLVALDTPSSGPVDPLDELHGRDQLVRRGNPRSAGRIRVCLHESEVGLCAEPAGHDCGPGHDGGRCGRERGRHVVRRLWRQDRRHGGRCQRLSAPGRHAVLHPVLCGVAEGVRFARSHCAGQQPLRRDAAPYARRVLRQLLRSRICPIMRPPIGAAISRGSLP